MSEETKKRAVYDVDEGRPTTDDGRRLIAAMAIVRCRLSLYDC
jgi:hypothetical protein